jgi:hypothetical protein
LITVFDECPLSADDALWEEGATGVGNRRGEEPDRRIVERCPVDEAARLRPVVARNQPQPPAAPVTIVSVSARGAGLRGGSAVDLVQGHLVELGIDDDWSRCRVVWSAEGIDGAPVGGVEFVEDHPGFMPALLAWIEREAAERDR